MAGGSRTMERSSHLHVANLRLSSFILFYFFYILPCSLLVLDHTAGEESAEERRAPSNCP